MATVKLLPNCIVIHHHHYHHDYHDGIGFGGLWLRSALEKFLFRFCKKRERVSERETIIYLFI